MSPWTGYLPLPTFRRQMASYACAWIPMTSMRPSTEIITRCPLWRKLLTSLHTPATSPSWTPAMDTGQSYSTRNPAYLWLSTVPSEDTISCNFLWPHLFPRHLPEGDGSDPRRVPRMHQNHKLHHHLWLQWDGTWYPPMKPHMDCLQIQSGV